MTDIKKIIDTFVEAPAFDDRNKDILSQNSLFTTKKGKFVKTEKMGHDLEADIYDVKAYNFYSIMIRKNQERIGVMEIDYNTNPSIFLPRMKTIAIKPEARGKGYSKIFYNWVINYFGGIISDETLTGEDGHGSFQLWQYLSKKYPTYIFRMKETTIIPIKGGITDDLMDNKNDRFMCSKEPVDYQAYNKKFAKPVPIPKYVRNQQAGKLEETPSFSDSNLSMGKKSVDDDAHNRKAYSNAGELIDTRKLRGIFKLDLFEDSDRGKKYYEVFALEGDEIIGRVKTIRSADPNYFNPQFPVVEYSYVYERYQGKGIATAMYEMIIDVAGGLYSDRTLTGSEGKGSFALWQKLATLYHPYIRHRISGDKFKIIPVKEFTMEMMGDPNDRFLVSYQPISLDKNGIPADDLVSVSEVELMTHKGESDIDASDPNEWDFYSGQKLIEKKLANGLIFLKTKIPHSTDVKYALKDPKSNVIISGMRAKIDPQDYKVEPTEAQISSVVTGEQYRNKGFGKLLYKLVLDAEKTIVSDYQLYPGAASIWKNYLPTIANVYNFNEDGELEPFNFVNGTSKDGIFDYFVASKKKLL